jgi:phosphoribosylaminoimidazolecarboxamide formyltransferase / IMP cyclohydrolase
MNKKITSALISVYYKDGLDDLIRELHAHNVILYSTGGTQQFIESLGIPCVAVETITSYPSILGGRVKTLHPKIFGGILGRRHLEQDQADMMEYAIPTIDLVIVDLYPFEETVAATTEEAQIIEKIDIGGPSMIRAAAKNFTDVTVLASKSDYGNLLQILRMQQGQVNLEQRRQFAAKAFEVVMHYDIAISNYFNTETSILRYGENPHQKAKFTGKLSELCTQLHGKELSYNNLVDVDAAMQLLAEFTNEPQSLFAIIKHTNVCGVAIRPELADAWHTALACDPESAFGGVLICNRVMDLDTATAISDIFFEVLIAPGFNPDALMILQQKKNRILLHQHHPIQPLPSQRSVLQGMIMQDADQGNTATWLEEGGRACTDAEKEDMLVANLICKHLKSNAIALVKNKQLLGKGCGQTSRIDALKQSIDKAAQFGFDLSGAVLASDAFFPFDDCVRMAHAAGITALIQPGGSIRDKDSIAYCKDNNLAMVITGMRHFRH